MVGNITHWRFPADVTVWAGPMYAGTGWYLFDLPIGDYGNTDVDGKHLELTVFCIWLLVQTGARERRSIKDANFFFGALRSTTWKQRKLLRP